MSNTKIPGGCMGKVLSINLSNYGKNNDAIFQDIEIDAEHYEKLLTGYGLAGKIIYDNQKPGLGPLDADNVFAVMSGLLTGTGAMFSGRFMIAGKSPLTGLWGEANSGGYFAPTIKKTGYDGFFFIGKSDKPVYLYIDDDTTELRDAADLWGKNSYDTQDALLKKYGSTFKVACIGPAGEECSLISGVVTDGGRLAARCGLGALMGSKKLKALCLGGTRSIPVEYVEKVSEADLEFIDQLNDYKHLWFDKMVAKATTIPLLSGILRFLSKHCKKLWAKVDGTEVERYVMKTYGTAGAVATYADQLLSPIRNWSGYAPKNFPTKLARKISSDAVIRYNESRYNCHHCPLGCGAEENIEKFNKEAPDDIFNLPPKSKEPFARGPHKPEYETLCGFGDMVVNDSIYSIVKANDLCNRAGLDTISTSVTVAWAFEAYEKGVLTREDTDGLELIWGKNKKERAKSAKTLVKLVEKICRAKRTEDGKKSIGEILLDGVERAAASIDKIKGTDSIHYAMNCGKQELSMYDTRNRDMLSLAVAYEAEPTPGRHTVNMPGIAEGYPGYKPPPSPKDNNSSVQGTEHRRKFAHSHPLKKNSDEDINDAVAFAEGSKFMGIINCCGLCYFGFGLVTDKDGADQMPLVQWINAATGWLDKDINFYLDIGHRSKAIRKLFNFEKCGSTNPAPLLQEEATRKFPHINKKSTALEIAEIKKLYYEVLGYDKETGKPLDKTLKKLGISGMKPIKLNFTC